MNLFEMARTKPTPCLILNDVNSIRMDQFSYGSGSDRHKETDHLLDGLTLIQRSEVSVPSDTLGSSSLMKPGMWDKKTEFRLLDLEW